MFESTTISSPESSPGTLFLHRYSRNVAATLTATVLLILLLTVALWPLVAHDALLGWSMLVCTAQAGQAWQARRYLTLRQDCPREPHVWKRRFLALAVCSGAAWSTSFMAFGLVVRDPAFFALLFAIAGVTAYGGMAKLPILSIALAFEIAVLLPLSAWLFLQGGAIPEFMGIVVILYLAMLSLLFRQTSIVVAQRHSLQAQDKELSTLRQESDHRVDRFLECVPGLFFTIRRDCDGTVTMPFVRCSSPSFLGGYPEGVAQSLNPLLVLCHPEDRDRLLAELHASAEEQRPCHAEFRIGDPSGSQTMMEFTAQPQQCDEPGVTEWHGFMQDITERRLLEEQLRMKGAALDHSSEALFLVGEQGEFVYVNEQACRSLGYSREELLTMGVPDIDPDFQMSMSQEHRKIAHQAGVVVFETRHKRRDGSTFPVEIQASDLDYNGQQFGLALVRDISERKRMEASLSKTERDFLSLAENIPDNISRFDAEGRYLYINPTHQRSLRKSNREVFGKRLCEVFPGGELVRAAAAIDDVIATGVAASLLRIPVLAETGEWRFHDVRYVPERNETGKVVGVLGIGRDMTENYRMQEALAAREQEFRSLAENSPDGIIRYDREGRRLYVNATVERVTGKSRTELLGTSAIEAVLSPSIDPVRAHQYVMEAMQTGERRLFELNFTAADGRPVTFQQVYVPEFAADGSVQGALGIAHDITEIKQAEKALAEREQEFRCLAESSPDNIVRYDREGRHRYLNARLVRQLGLSSMDEALGKRPSVIWPDARFAALEEAAARVVADGEMTEFELVAPDGKGGRMHHLICVVPERDVHGSIVGTIAYGRDISESKRMELALAAREAEFRSLAENSPDAIFRYDRNGIRLFVNQTVERLTGKPRELLVGKSLADVELNPAIDPIRAHQLLMEVMRTGERRDFETTFTAADGKQVTFHQVFVPEFAADGSVQSALGIGRDITERKRLELEVAKREYEFRTLVENASDTVARYSKDLHRLYVNPAFARLMEGGADALVGKRPSDTPNAIHGKFYEEKLTEVLTTGNEIEFEMKWLEKSGREVCSLVSLTPEFGKDGTVESVLAVGRDISELYAVRQKIHQMAFYDALTELPNRALFNDRLHQMIADASWHHQLGGVMMLDMDRFKEINDTMGHAVGDELLREAGTRLSACVRSYDTVARLGGDEFAILLPDVRHGDDIGRVADKMRSAFDQPFLLAGKEVFLSCSIGIALYPNDSTEADDLVKFADSAMYYAKRSGRNAFRFYSRELTESANERLMLESDLRRAVERGELEMYYQPKVRLSDGAMIGSETLLRWKHPQHGMIPPDKFIPIAEDCGLIVEIGDWVLRESCRAAAALNEAGKPTHKVAINLSARQFQTGNLAATVSQVLEETHCRPEWIELEITESLLLDEDGRVLEILRALRSMDITIAIDDFGTGYSALSYLARFPITTLKIDRSFVGRIDTDSFRAELVKAILSIAHCLGQEVVAEGVETTGQASFLTAHGCQVAQGYLFSRPVPMAEFAALPRTFQIAQKMPVASIPSFPQKDYGP